MTDYPLTVIDPSRRPSRQHSRQLGYVDQNRRTPGQPAGISLDEVAALVERASGADAAAIGGLEAAIEALEAIAASLRRARDARAQLAARVLTQMLRQVLIARAGTPSSPQPGHPGEPTL